MESESQLIPDYLDSAGLASVYVDTSAETIHEKCESCVPIHFTRMTKSHNSEIRHTAKNRFFAVYQLFFESQFPDVYQLSDKNRFLHALQQLNYIFWTRSA